MTTASGERLARGARREVLPCRRKEDDGALTVHHDDTFASLRVVTIAEGLEMVSLTQILAWDLPLDNEIRDKVAADSRTTRCWARCRWPSRWPVAASRT